MRKSLFWVFGLTACVQQLPQPGGAAGPPGHRAADAIDQSFDPALPHPAGFDGRTVVLAAGSETITPTEREAETGTVDRVLAAFTLDALPYRGPEFKVSTTVVLDPNLVGEESRRATPGLCYTGSHTVVLNRGLWRSYGEAEREVVLYHELGHCELGRRHVEGERPGGGPLSLMKRNAVAAVSYFIADRDYYVHELFTSRQAPAHFILHTRLEAWPPKTLVPAVGWPLPSKRNSG